MTKSYRMSYKCNSHMTIVKYFQAETKTEAKAAAKEYIHESFSEWEDDFNKKCIITEDSTNGNFKEEN